MRLARLTIAALALLAVSSAGCAKKPTMKVNHAEVAGVQLGFPPQLNVVMTVVVDVTNPNSYDVAIRAVRGTVVMADKYILPVDFRAQGEGVWLAADALTQVRVPVTLPVDLAMTLLRESYLQPAITYRMVGKADVTATRSLKLEKDNYEVDERGQIDRAAVEASLRSVMIPFPR